MKKRTLWLLIIPITVAIVSVFSLSSCAPKVAEETTAAETVAETEAATTTEAPETTAKGPIKIGVLAVLTGPFSMFGEDSVDGVKLGFEEVDYTVAGRKIELVIEATDMSADVAVDRMRSAVQQGCQIVLGPLSGSEGLAIKNSADEWPDTTIIVVAAAAEDVTMRGIKPNVWRTAITGAQVMFPFGDWLYDQGYKRIVTIGEDYDFPYAQVGGLLKTFTAKGGEIVKKFWVPFGTTDYSAIIASIPKDIDGIYVSLSGTDVISFLSQSKGYGLEAPVLGGATSLDVNTLAAMGEKLDGVISCSAGTGVSDRPEFKSLDARYYALRGRPLPLFTWEYYTGPQLVIEALNKINGNIEDQEAFRAAIQETVIKGPCSDIAFDEYHQAVIDIYINQVQLDKASGFWKNFPIKVYPKVSQFWTFDPEEYQKQPSYTKESIDQMFPDAK